MASDDEQEQVRARLYRMASEHPDPAKREAARRMLDVLPKRSVTIDQAVPERHDFGNAPPDEPRTIDAPQVSKLNKMLAPLTTPREDVTGPLLRRYFNALTFGGQNLLDDLGGADSPEQRAAFDAKHPFASTVASTAGVLTPAGATSAVARGVEGMGAQAIGRMSPKLQALVAGVRSVPIVGRAAEGAALGGAVGGLAGGAAARGGPGDVAAGAANGVGQGAAFGAGAGAVSSAAGQTADLLRTDDIKLLEKYGAEPSVVPGRPVVNQGASLPQMIRQPSPTGVRRASPDTRQAAGLESADAIVSDIAAREQANNARLADLRQGNVVKYTPQAAGREGPSVGVDPAPVRDIIDVLRRRADLPNATRGTLGQLSDRVSEISGGPSEVQVFDPAASAGDMSAGETLAMLEKARARVKGPSAQALDEEIARVRRMATHTETVPPGPDSRASPIDMQGLKALARNLGKQDKIQGVTASEGAVRSVADVANDTLPAEMQAQDRSYYEARRRTEGAKEALGLSRRGTVATEEEIPISDGDGSDNEGAGDLDIADRSLVEKAGSRLAQRGEETKAGANASRRVQQLYDEGPAQLMEGAQAPDQISYRSLMDAPRLQLAQERLQADPRVVFSGAGPRRLASVAGGRGAYPVLRDLGELDTGPVSVAGHDLIGILRLRQQLEEQKRRQEEGRRASEALLNGPSNE